MELQEDRGMVPCDMALWRGYALSGWWRVGTRIVRADIPRAVPDTSGATASSR